MNHEETGLHIFAVCIGQGDNIGDIVLRRSLLRCLRAGGKLHILVADEPDDYVAGLIPVDQDRVYRDAASWKKNLRDLARQAPVLLVDNPGEVLIHLNNLREASRFSPLMKFLKSHGGRVVRLGIGSRTMPNLLQKYAVQWLFQRYDEIAWRDSASQERFGFGSLMPDWAFADVGPDGDVRPEQSSNVRRLAIISLRADKPFPSRRWFDGVRGFCAEAGLEPKVVTQVRRDQARSIEVARELQADMLGWNENDDALTQERLLRNEYRRAAIAISDRLHVLIIAMTEGVAPLCIAEWPELKAGRHFDAIGYRGSSVDVSGMTASEIRALCTSAVRRRSEAIELATMAKAEVARAVPLIFGHKAVIGCRSRLQFL